MKYLSYLLLIVSVITGIIFALFAWLNAIADTYFYWAIGKYFQTGIYPFAYPYLYDKPTTISPPAYGVLLMVLEQFARADIILHILQLLLLILTSVLIYKILLTFIGKHLAIIASCLHFLIPGNLIYTSYALTETGAQFLITLYVYLIWLYLIRHRSIWLELAIFLGFAMTLWKYSFLIYGLFALYLFIRRLPRQFHSYLLPTLGFIIIPFWIIINYQITGVWGLSDSKGIQLWNQAVWVGKILPSASSPSLQELKKYVPAQVNLYSGYWDIQQYILPKVNQSWKKTDEIIGQVAFAAVKEHPFKYAINSANIYWQLHTKGIPYWDNLWLFGKKFTGQQLFCGNHGSIRFCEPIIKTTWSYTIWNSFVEVSNNFYTYIFPIITVIFFFPSTLILLTHREYRIFPLLYLIGTVPIAMYVHPDPRYILPFYPLLVICVFLMPRALPRKSIVLPPAEVAKATIDTTASSKDKSEISLS